MVGQNNLAVTVQKKDKDCSVSASLQVRRSDDFDSSAMLNTVSYNGNPDDVTEKDADSSTPAEKLAFKDGKFESTEDGYITVSKAKLDSGNVFYGYNYDNQKRELMAGVKVSQDINLPIDLPKWTWESGEPIADNQETKDQLIAIYKDIWKLIEAKDWDKLNKLFELRDKEMATAFYTGGKNGTTVDKIRETNKNKDLVTVDDTTAKKVMFTNIFANDKLVKLSGWNGSGILIFNKDGSETYDLTFAKIDGKFVIVD